MRDVSTAAVVLLAELEGLELGDEVDVVADRLAQLLAFSREIDGLAPDDAEIDARFDPSWAPAS